MNERIKELVKQAGLNIDGYGYPIWGCLDSEEAKKEFLEKFAELIVADCSEIVRGVLREEGSTLSYKDAAKLQERFKEAFNIEPDWSEP